MNVFHDNSPKNRLLGILKNLLEQPCHYTIKMLAARYNVSQSIIKKDFDELKNAWFTLKYDKQYRYYLVSDKSLEHLEDVLFFTGPEKEFLLEALTKANATDKRLEKIRSKLERIYDVSKLGSSLFSRTFLDKANLLEQARKQKRVTTLLNYRSTMSSQVSNRVVEPFHISTKEDILHAYDLERKEIRHFRISRIERVELQTENWQHETLHHVAATDPFRIVSDQQVYIHLKLKTGAVNELIDKFPVSQAYIQPSSTEKDIYHFECKVNAEFKGISNFILGHSEYIVEIVEPESLIEHINKKVQGIKF
ncbi:YafY family protein [Emticicia sp. 21SJ11W-3]|uniref:helix-turn-helix transcriptional regulator n=1 Tax=Emticicia sp. 21SJ11W-3 TaxID=2916755 RepID=UPI0020A12329|nr:WYL domain-containing protein [Emticicia sp. 21SJ11W-3]UTA67677.1 WYL domain-containing protein [Emticicia sp. 21SJ11W-3]